MGVDASSLIWADTEFWISFMMSVLSSDLKFLTVSRQSILSGVGWYWLSYGPPLLLFPLSPIVKRLLVDEVLPRLRLVLVTVCSSTTTLSAGVGLLISMNMVVFLCGGR